MIKWPYTNLHELNLDWLIQKVKALEDQISTFPEVLEKFEELQEEVENLNTLYEGFSAEIRQEFTELRAQILAQMSELSAEIRQEFTEFKDDVDVEIINLRELVFALNTRIDYVLNNLPSQVFMVSPFTGEEDSLQNIIYALADQGRTESLTAAEYDDLDLTASAYDTRALTAYEYDWKGKILLA